MSDATTVTVDVSKRDADSFLEHVSSRVRLKVEVKRGWFMFDKFTITGPADLVQAALDEAEDHRRRNEW